MWEIPFLSLLNVYKDFLISKLLIQTEVIFALFNSAKSAVDSNELFQFCVLCVFVCV